MELAQVLASFSSTYLNLPKPALTSVATTSYGLLLAKCVNSSTQSFLSFGFVFLLCRE